MTRVALKEAASDKVLLARDLVARNEARSGWCLAGLAGRFVEVAGSADSAALSMTAGLIRAVQCRGEWAAWVGREGAAFYPPDFAALGIDLAALPCVWIQNDREACRVADTLLRSGSFALVVLDLASMGALPIGIQTRLAGLAKKHHSLLLCLTEQEPDKTSQGSLVSLRVEAGKTRLGHDGFMCSIRAIKDKFGIPGWIHRETCCGAGGLC